MLAAVAVALLAIGVKALINASVGSNLGYLSYVSGVIIAGWIAGSRGALVATLACALAEVVVFNSGSSATVPTSALANLRLALFVFYGAVVAVVTARLRRAAVREKSARQIGEARLVAQQEARAAAEHDRAQLVRLQAVTASLTGAVTPEDVATAILDRGLTALGALAGVVFRIDADRPSLTVLASRGYPDALQPSTAEYVPPPRSHVRQVLADGRPLFLSDPAEWTGRFPDTPPTSLPDSPSGGSIALLRLDVGRRPVGLVIFRFADPRDFADGIGELSVRLAEQGAGALDRAMACSEEQHVPGAQRGQDRLTSSHGSASDRPGVRLHRAGGSAGRRRGRADLADWCAVGLLDGDRPILATAGTSLAGERAVEHLAAMARRRASGCGSPLMPPRAGRGRRPSTRRGRGGSGSPRRGDHGRARHDGRAHRPDPGPQWRGGSARSCSGRDPGPVRGRRPRDDPRRCRSDWHRGRAGPAVRRRRPVQGDRRRERRRRLHVRSADAAPHLCQPRWRRPRRPGPGEPVSEDSVCASSPTTSAGRPRAPPDAPRQPEPGADLHRRARPRRPERDPGRGASSRRSPCRTAGRPRS